MSATETWTIGRLLAWTADYLKKQGADSPRLDAEVLLAEARGCRRIDLYTAFGEDPGETVRTAFRELVRRRAEGMPVAYLVGRKEFYSLSFRVTPDVLIPRPETEFVVLALLDLASRGRAAAGGAASEADGAANAAAVSAGLEVADVGTGSGVLAICAARQWPAARVTAVDISPAALEVARSNAREHGVADRIEFVQGDLLSALAADRRFDFIVSNPPYVSEPELAGLAREVRDHEPRLALAAGSRGTDVIARLVPQAAERLRDGGWLVMEIGPRIEEEVRGLIEGQGAFEAPSLIRDLARLPRVVAARRKSGSRG
jgi:release factor glutamine methyltransferase